MGYLDPYLVNNPGQIVSCNDLYPLLLKVRRYQPRIFEIARGDSEYKVALIIKDVIPDVEEWQHGGITRNYYLYKFHNPNQRAQARTRLESMGYRTEIRDLPYGGTL